MNNAAGRNVGVLKVALAVTVAAFFFGFAMVPLYRITCEHVFGIRLANGAASAGTVAGFREDDTRLITVEFVANVNSKLPWSFGPDQTRVQVHPGKLTEVWFHATNDGDTAIVGNAVPSVAPAQASAYFNKTECFCFTQQLLKPGESRRLPVRFIVDPKLPQDIQQLTLSYTFYENNIATQHVGQTGSPLSSPAS